MSKSPQIVFERVCKKQIFFAPEGDRKLTINIREDLQKRVKIAAIEKEMTAGEIIEQLVEKHL